MPESISNSLLSQLSELVSSLAGLYFPKEKWQDLERGIIATARELNFKDTQSFVQRLLTSSLAEEQLDTMVGYLTIGETFFFRDKNLFQVLKDRIISGWLGADNKKERSIKFLSAGCCSGEEPYSIAILMDQMRPALKNWKITIEAVDINPRFLQKAEKGIYTRWSLRDTPDIIVKKYFKEIGKNSFEISPHIKKMVKFSRLNLAEKRYPSPLDNIRGMNIIFCRNVLMYFASETRQRVIQGLARALKKDGWLIVGASETAFVLQPGLHSVLFSGTILHRKGVSRKKDPTKIESQPEARASFSFKDLGQNFTKVTSITPVSNRLSEIGSSEAFKSGKRPEREDESIHARREIDKKPLKKPGESIQDKYQKALSLHEQDRYEESAQKLQKLLSQEKKDNNVFLLKSESMALLGSALANLGKLDEAKKWCRQAINAEKLRPGYYYLLASIYQEQGNLNESVKLLKKAIYLDSKFVMAHFVLSNLAKKQNRLDEAQKHLKNTLSLLCTAYPEEILPHSEGMNAKRLSELIKSMIGD